ncbi:BLUF domain-containing protein [Vibrio mexicanus]|uniref:BLUF domain-containing protein n=1 Tax=Vibrio mexicanus TaxID=1004326 RepID=UPI00063C7708|nr:BLUF domain-containing protein [Vibrio mexicanus]
MHLVRLIYASTITSHNDPGIIENILESARRFNPANDLTGILYFNGDYFLQCIEGSRQAVNNVYTCILKDARHHTAVILDYSEISERTFSDWSMGYVPTSRTYNEYCLRYSNSREFNPYQMSGESAFKLLNELKQVLPSI